MPIAAARPGPDHPAIDGYDDPNANPPTNSVSTIINCLPSPDHTPAPVEPLPYRTAMPRSAKLMTTPTGLKALIDAMKDHGGKQGEHITIPPT